MVPKAGFADLLAPAAGRVDGEGIQLRGMPVGTRVSTLSRRSRLAVSLVAVCTALAFLPGVATSADAAVSADLGSLIVADRVDVTTRWSSVVFSSPFEPRFSEPPVVVAGPASWVGRDPATVRVRNVTGTGFDIRLTEWPYLDGNHTIETVAYLAVPEGRHVLPSGAVVEAGSATVAAGGSDVSFSTAFSERPMLISTVVASSGPALAARADVGLSGFSVRLDAEEADSGSYGGTVNWVAWSPGSDDGISDGVAWETRRKAINNSFTRFSFDRAYVRPCALADMNTLNGGDTANLRYRKLRVRSVRLRIDEEKSANAEVAHVAERVGLLVIECAKFPPLLIPDFEFGETLVGTPTVLGATVVTSEEVSVSVAIRHRASGDWLQRDGTFGPLIRRFDAVDQWGHWSYEVELPDDEYSLSMRARDERDNEVVLSPWRHFTVSAEPTAFGTVLAAADGLTSIQLDAAGNPVIAYSHEGLAKVIHCHDPDCADFSEPNAAGPAPTPPDHSEEWTGLDLELDAAGNPVIAAGGAVIHCVDPDCEQAASVVDFGPFVETPSLELDEAGNPVVSSGGLTLMHCVDPNCADTPVFGRNFEEGEVRWTSLALDAAGNPVIASWDWSAGRDWSAPLLLTHCTDPNCQAPLSQVMLDSGFSENDKAVSMVLDAAGNPVMAVRQVQLDSPHVERLRVIRCTDPDCAGPFSAHEIADGGMDFSLALSPTGLPLVAHGRGSLLLARCTDAACAGSPRATSVDNDFVSPRWVSMVVDNAGTAYISYYDANQGDLRFARVPAP